MTNGLLESTSWTLWNFFGVRFNNSDPRPSVHFQWKWKKLTRSCDFCFKWFEITVLVTPFFIFSYFLFRLPERFLNSSSHLWFSLKISVFWKFKLTFIAAPGVDLFTNLLRSTFLLSEWQLNQISFKISLFCIIFIKYFNPE